MAPGKLERHDSSLRGSTRPRTHQNQTSIVHLGVFRRRDDRPTGRILFSEVHRIGQSFDDRRPHTPYQDGSPVGCVSRHLVAWPSRPCRLAPAGSTRLPTHQNQTPIVHLGVFRRRDNQPRGRILLSAVQRIGESFDDRRPHTPYQDGSPVEPSVLRPPRGIALGNRTHVIDLGSNRDSGLDDCLADPLLNWPPVET
jgi:hypothetical protein